jgi:hypothetical protein
MRDAHGDGQLLLHERIEIWRSAMLLSSEAMRSTICGASPSVG